MSYVIVDVESDGPIEIRKYPAMVTAGTEVRGARQAALVEGFRTLADYIFAKSRDGEKLPMTAPVLSSGGGNGEWLIRFIMPARFTRDTLPEAGGGVRIDTLPARRVAAMAFSGTADDATLAEKEALLRSWLGAKKYKVRGEAEHAFYNSPFIPAPMRRTEILIPIEG